MKIALGRGLAAIKAEIMADLDAAAEAERMALADELPAQAQQWQGRLIGIDMLRLKAKRRIATAQTIEEARAARESWKGEA